MTCRIHRRIGLACLTAVIAQGMAAAGSAAEERRDLAEAVRSGSPGEARASWWGFDASDATATLQRAIDSRVRRLIIDRQASPWITRPLRAVSDQEIVLESGVEVIALKGAYQGSNDCLLTLDRCSNVTIRGERNESGAVPVLRMHGDDYRSDSYRRSEWRHGLAILGCSNVVVADLRIESTGGDGIYLGSGSGRPNRQVVIRGVDCYANHRQGISVISADSLLIENCTLRNTAGTAPQAGIDFEPNDPRDILTKCTVRNCIATGNAGTGYQICLQELNAQSEPVGITLEGCVSRNNRQHAVHLVGSQAGAPPGRLVIRRLTAEQDAMCGLSVQFNPHDAIRIDLTDSSLRHCARNDDFFAPVYIEGGGDANRPAGNIHMRDVLIEDDVDRPPVHIRGRDRHPPDTLIRNCTGSIRLRRNGEERVLPLEDAAR